MKQMEEDKRERREREGEEENLLPLATDFS